MPHRRHRFLSGIFLVIGTVLCASSLVLGADFLRAAQEIIMLGSIIQPGGVITESLFIVLFFIVLFGAGLSLIILSVGNLRKSFKKY